MENEKNLISHFTKTENILRSWQTFNPKIKGKK